MPIYEADGQTLVDANTLAEAEYRIRATGTCTDSYSASLGSGINVVGTTLVLTIPENDLTVSGTNGEYTHMLRVARSVGELEAPVFNSIVQIIPVCEIP